LKSEHKFEPRKCEFLPSLKLKGVILSSESKCPNEVFDLVKIASTETTTSQPNFNLFVW